MASVNGSTSAFDMPRRLVSRRKRRVDALTSSAFFTSTDYAAFSALGDAHESQLYAELEAHRHTLVTSSSGHSSAATPRIRREVTHLAQLLAECVTSHRIRPPSATDELDNARRRVSAISIGEHERYLLLQRTLFQAQRHGLPGILALSADEAKQWQRLENDVKAEQALFCNMMARGMAAETASQQTAVPAFVTTWYEAMLAQCRNDVYRLYPRYFEPSLTVPLPDDVAGESTTPPVEVKRATEVATRGTCCTVDLSTLVAGQSLRLAADDGGALAFAVGPPCQAISADSQAEQLMDQYDCDLAISSSTLVTLFDSDTSTRFAQHPTGWGIPMKSRVIVRGGSKGSKKQIYLDRPLPGSSPSTREKIAEAGRAALLSRFETESITEGSTGGRTTYHVWQLGGKRVLVRSTTHACTAAAASVGSTRQESTATSSGVDADTPADENEASKQQSKQKAVPLSVFVKPDYRSLGVEEQLTTSERCRLWLHSWLRGSSTVLVARFHPKTGVVDAWETHSLTSLVYGDDAHQTPPLEYFDPMTKFQWVTDLFAALGDAPVGNYLLRWRGERIGTSRRERGLLEVLMATGEPARVPVGDESSSAVVDLYQYVADNNKQSRTNPLVDSEFVLPAWNLPGRIPYTFHTGTYCQPFFLDGVCPRVANDEDCEYMHLRLLQRGSARKSAKTGGCWRFENYSKVLKEAARTNFEVMKQPVNVTPDFAFCVDARAPPPSVSLASLHARTYCAKPANECNLPHLTLHDVLECLADGMLRTERQKRRKYKGINRRQRETERATRISSRRADQPTSMQ